MRGYKSCNVYNFLHRQEQVYLQVLTRLQDIKQYMLHTQNIDHHQQEIDDFPVVAWFDHMVGVQVFFALKKTKIDFPVVIFVCRINFNRKNF